MSNWKMPLPEMGDVVLFSTDQRNFSDPTVGWVTAIGQKTINILTITPTGFVQRSSCHHREDPDLLGDHGWQDLGTWDFSKTTAAVRELMAPTPKAEKRSARDSDK